MPASPDIFFVLEAPNRDDTFDPDKGYLTYDYDTDPSGRLFRELFVLDLGEPIEALAVTNGSGTSSEQECECATGRPEPSLKRPN